MDLYDDWTNPETQAVVTIITAGDKYKHTVLAFCDDAVEKDAQNPHPYLAQYLKEMVEDMATEFYFKELDEERRMNMGAFFNSVGSRWRVNYDEIAEFLLAKGKEAFQRSDIQRKPL